MSSPLLLNLARASCRDTASAARIATVISSCCDVTALAAAASSEPLESLLYAITITNNDDTLLPLNHVFNVET